MRIKRILKYSGISVAILIIGFLAVAQIAYQSIPQIEPPGKMYSVNGGEIHMHCTGPEDNSKPTIIIISGGTTPSFAYFDLQEKLSETVRTCTYDTAGIGWSPANDIPHTTKNLSNELHLLLQSAKIDSSIILAGHSLGGIVSLIYSAEHEEQVTGIVFIDSSHYNQYDYFGKEYRDATFKQIEGPLPYVWLIELKSNLGISKLMAIFDTSMSEEHIEEHNMLESIHKWNSPYSTMKSMASNFKLSFEQGKEAHYDRGDLPIVVITAGSPIVSDSQEIGGISAEEFRKGFDILQKDLAELSSNSKHVFVDKTNHGSIITSDKTAEHILSLIPNFESSKITTDVKNTETCPLPSSSRCFTEIITEIIDGDLIQVSNGKISFALVSAPELDEKIGIGSKAFVETLCPIGSEVLVDQDDLQSLESIGGSSILSAVVYCNDVNLNEALINSQHGELQSELCDVSEFADELWTIDGCFE